MADDHLEKVNSQCFNHIKEHLIKEKFVHEGLNLDEKSSQTYFMNHELVKAFQALITKLLSPLLDESRMSTLNL